MSETCLRIENENRMDPEISILHSVEAGKLKSESMVKIFLSSEYNRKIPSAASSCSFDSSDTDPVDAIWAERLAQNPRLFNGTKFRIHDVIDSEVQGGHICMFLGVTDYKEYIGTNWAPNVKEIQRQGLELYKNPQAFLSDALGVGACVVTKDDHIILLRRSEHCAEAPALWDVPGGHAEPKKVVGDKPLRDIDISSINSSAVVHEIFDSILQEVTDEVGIPLDQLGKPLYTGTHRNITSAGRPSVAFEIRCSLTTEEIQALYRIGSQHEADESTGIMFIPLSEISSMEAEKLGVWKQMAPSAKGNFTCFCIAHGLKKL